MENKRTKTMLAYTLTQKEQDGEALLDLLLQSIGDAWVEILLQETHTNKVSIYMLSTFAPSLRGIQVEQHTTLSLYVKDHWYLFAGGIWQVSWSSGNKRLELSPLCSKDIELAEIEQLPLSPEEERRERAIQYASHTVTAHNHFLRRSSEPPEGEFVFKEMEMVRSEEIEVEQFGEQLSRGFTHELPTQAWVITFLCSPEEENPARELDVLIGYYSSRPPYTCYRLRRTNKTFSLGKVYI